MQKKYEGTRKQYELASQSSREAIEQAIETETIRSLKLQNYRVNQIHKNQQNIEAKQRRNNELLSEIRRSQGIWTGLYEELNRSLKIAGDLCNYAEYIENEMKELDG